MEINIICPKCGHKRSETDDPNVPPGQCPACNIFYIKFINQQTNNSTPTSDTQEQTSEKPGLLKVAPVRTHYDTLKVKRDATIGEIKEAYDALFESYRPDKFKGNKESAEKVMAHINSAYEILMNPKKRAIHDSWIKHEESGEPKVDVRLSSTEKVSRILSSIRFGNLIKLAQHYFNSAKNTSLKTALKGIRSNRITLIKYSAVVLFSAIILITENPISSYLYDTDLFSREVSGEVFIKTKGGNNFKLSLVEINATRLGRREASKAQEVVLEKRHTDLDTYTHNKITWEAYSTLVIDYVKLLTLSVTKKDQSIKTLTDSDGKFKLRLRRWGYYLLSAEDSRSLFGETEKYVWVLVVDSTNDNITLSNNTLTN